MTTPVAQQVTFTDLLAVLFPTGTDGYLKLVAEGSQRQVEYWFRRSPEGTWLWQRQYGYKEPPTTMEQFLAANDADLYFSPVLWTVPAVGSAPIPPAAVWTGLRLPLLAPTARSLTVPRADVGAAERARQRLAEFSPAPSVVLHEGNRVVGLWLLTVPLGDLSQVDRALRALAGTLRGNYVPPAEALLAVPDTRVTRLHPAHTVEAITWEPATRYAWGALAHTEDCLHSPGL